VFGLLRRFGEAFKHLLTAKDGETYTPARVYWCLAALEFLGLAAWSVIAHGQQFNATDFGTGAGLILTAGGVGVWLTRKSEPDD
jgi:hypothetical protein